jgi:hypothetical protein
MGTSNAFGTASGHVFCPGLTILFLANVDAGDVLEDFLVLGIDFSR